MSQRIIKLSEDVINRIAAGEVVQQPCNALKELIENSIDAKATNITIVLNNSGIDELRIEDNGAGIVKEDFHLLCERFATSKLRQFSDLTNIATFGFRGEALASISFVSELTITSKVADNVCAYTARFLNGTFANNGNKEKQPKPVAGTNGTQITCKNLFYNLPLRRKALLNKVSQEYNECLKVVTYYSIKHPKISFTLKKIGKKRGSSYGTCKSKNKNSKSVKKNQSSGNCQMIDLQSKGGKNSTTLGVIKQHYGSRLSDYLIPISLKHDKMKQIKVNGFITNCDYMMNVGNMSNNSSNKSNSNSNSNGNSNKSSNSNSNSNNSSVQRVKHLKNKRIEFILFINHRLVQCNSIKKCILSCYEDYTGSKKGSNLASSPFVYLDISIPSHLIDVNCHPTKKQVKFMHETSIIEMITNGVAQLLSKENNDRTYTAQSLQSFLNEMNKNVRSNDNDNSDSNNNNNDNSNANKKKNKNNKNKRVSIVSEFGKENQETDENGENSNDLNNSQNSKKGREKEKEKEKGNKRENESPNPAAATAAQESQQGKDIVTIDLASVNSKRSKRNHDKKKRKSDNIYVRTDSSQSKLHYFWHKNKNKSQITNNIPNFNPQKTQNRNMIDNDNDNGNSNDNNKNNNCKNEKTIERNRIKPPSCAVELYKHILEQCDRGLEQIFCGNVYVGCVDKVDKTKQKRDKKKNKNANKNNKEKSKSKSKNENSKKEKDCCEVINDELVIEATLRRCMFQYETKLYLVDMYRITRVWFFELCVKNISNFEYIYKLKSQNNNQDLNITNFILLALELPESNMITNETDSKQDIVDDAISVLCYPTVSNVLKKYFAIEIDCKNQTLISIPCLLHDYMPPFLYLPIFLLRLATQIQWFVDDSDEQDVDVDINGDDGDDDEDDDEYMKVDMSITLFKDISMEIAKFYQIRPKDFYIFGNDIEEKLESVIFQSFRKNKTAFHPPPFLCNDGSIIQVACTKQLYKVFERC